MQEHGCTASPRVPAIGDARVPRRDVNCRPGADRRLRSPDLADDDWRKTSPRFTKGNFEQNLRIIDEVQGVASELDATAAQVALACCSPKATTSPRSPAPSASLVLRRTP